MPLDFSPADAKALISDPTSGLCGNMVNTLLRLPVLFYKLILYLFNTDGNFTNDAVRQIHHPGDLIFSAAPLAESSQRLLCDGREVSQAAYPELYAALGVTWGAAGPGNFKIPDYRAKFPVGVGAFPLAGGAALGQSGGLDKVTLDETSLGVHRHVTARFDSNSGTAADKMWVLKGDETLPTGLCRAVSGGSSTLQEEDISVPAGDYANTSEAKFTSNPEPLTILPPYAASYIYIAT